MSGAATRAASSARLSPAAPAVLFRSQMRLPRELERHFQQSRFTRRRRSRLRTPAPGHGARPVEGAETVQESGTTRRAAAGAVPRSASHIRNTDGRGRRPTPSDSGMDGPPRLRARLVSMPTTHPTPLTERAGPRVPLPQEALTTPLLRKLAYEALSGGEPSAQPVVVRKLRSRPSNAR